LLNRVLPTRRRYWLVAALTLAVLIVGNWWINRAVQTEPQAPESVEQRIDYALSEFRAQFFDEQGTPTLNIAGPRLEHDTRNREARITRPRFVIDPSDQAWSGTAEHALIERESRRVMLQGAVRIEKSHPRGTVHIESEEVHYDRAAGTIHSPGPAYMEQSGNQLTGGTLTAWIDDERMELDQDVHAIYRAGNRAGDDAGGTAARD